ncbi:MAG: hypothetical protein BGP06_07810 [Rhizobiales bacterium 65-9]|nr:TetR/AcrR family transcriptional regulator [Hyphomicrobiales bacterium]OJY35700.1 MAG: hypothetical protein BGP06_07810 [Rhizobiales bacterium 65-9]
MKMSSGKASSEKQRAARLPQRKRGRERVASLLAAAASCFLDKGYDAATMTEIAERAGASIGSLYLFFPTKQALARSLLSNLADELSGRLEAMKAATAGRSAAAIADALFDALNGFIAANPVYSLLIDVTGDERWRQVVRAQRRRQIADLFARAEPPLGARQAQRLAVIVPHFMRISLLQGEAGSPSREAILEELRLMLRRHLESGG